ncbi:uncharacterized protein LOC115719286 [Cannabis sativa]|uniref:uncharacterized protein LOC115719286 n=1 Tax=Cannabis sativa TaxID=3483 RepID=UPI0029C9D87D|nr:uncharacterized protein LOC115719286 [Cannabis sativa]
MVHDRGWGMWVWGYESGSRYIPGYRFLHDVSNEEVRKALFQIHPDKSHAPDGMTPGFFQKYWDVVGQDIVSRVREFFNPCSLLNGLSQTNIVLISKKKHSVTIGDLRPISLCDVLHKMISKKHKGKEGYIALKLDLSKAYDRIDWSFLCTMMLKIRFDPQLVALILAIIYLVWYMVVNGGCELGPIISECGLHQGDPLSPYLFLLCTKGFTFIIKRFERCGI